VSLFSFNVGIAPGVVDLLSLARWPGLLLTVVWIGSAASRWIRRKVAGASVPG
jgi:hypothetical protein